jgi:lipid-A-disaccharide synthase
MSTARTSTLLKSRALHLVVIAGEHSGDALGAKLMERLNTERPGCIQYTGVGGEAMAVQGLTSLFPLSDVAVMGPLAILSQLPTLIARVHAAADAAITAKPDVVIIIDSPEFTHPIAKRIRSRAPHIPIIDYVSPSVWAWRPGRAKRMRAYIDHVMALLPFEPAAHQRLDGPPCTYVGHPLIERHAWLSSLNPQPLANRLGIAHETPILLVLPGSRATEVRRLIDDFGRTIARLHEQNIYPAILLPVVESVRPLVEQAITRWPAQPHLISGEDDKFRAFKLATAALAASGTVTLELALAGAPMVVAYKVDRIAAMFRFLLKTPSIVLANLVLGTNEIPEFIQERCTPRLLATAVAPLLSDTPERRTQLAALARIPACMLLPYGTPSRAAAAIVLRIADAGRAA